MNISLRTGWFQGMGVGLLVLGLGLAAAAEPPADFYRYTNYNPDLPEHTPQPAAFWMPTGFARPQAWWHWIDGNVSRAGIENDLREMADKGYGAVRIFHLGETGAGPLKFNSPEWFDTFRFAAETAHKYGLGLGIHVCEGFSEAGGPWITPELSMKELTYQITRATGNGAEQAITLPKLDRKMDFVRDIAVLAWPAKRPADLAMHRGVLARIAPATTDTKVDRDNTGVLFDGRREESISYSHNKKRPDQFCGFTLEFKEPFEAAGVYTEVLWKLELPKNIFIEASDDGVKFEKVCELQFKKADSAASFGPRRAKFWRLVRYQSPNPTERVRRGVVREHILKVAEFELLAPGEHSRAASPIDNFAAKAGVVYSAGEIAETTQSFPSRFMLRRDQVLDLTGRTQGGVLRWTVPPGEWRVMRIGYTTTGEMNHPASPAGIGLEVDKFEARAIEHHFSAYPKRMIAAAGSLAGKTFSIIETDSWEAGHQNWTQRFPEYFRARNGYDIIPWLPVYAGECIEDVATTENFLRDLRQTFSSLVMDNFYGKLGELVRSSGLRYETEPAGGIYMRNPMNSYREADIPMSEIWQTPRKPGVVLGVRRSAAREVSSAAHFYGKQYVTCEALTSLKGNWAETPWTMKGTADTILMCGFNTTVFHSYTHQPDERAPGWQMDPWGVSLNRKLPWWKFARPWFDSIARNQYMLQQGKSAARILALYSDEVPSSGSSIELAGNHTYDVIEGDGVRRFLKVQDGRLISPGRMAYELLVVSPKTTLQLATLERLRELLAAGAAISAQAKPSSPPSLRGGAAAAARWRELVQELYGDGRKAARRVGRGTFYVGHTANEAATARGIRESFRCTLNGASSGDIGWRHREHADGTEWFWVINCKPSASRSGLFSFRVTGKDVALWWPETGQIERAPAYFEKDGYTHVPLTLDRMEGVFVVFQGRPSPCAVVRAVWEGTELFPARGATNTLDQTKIAPRLFVCDSGIGAEFSVPGTLQLQHADGSKGALTAEKIPTAQRLAGPFSVTFDSKWGGPAEPQVFPTLASWTKSAQPGVKHYSGTAVYTKEFDLDGANLAPDLRAALQLDEVAEVAEVTLNGQRVGVLWRPPYRLDVTRFLRAGRNELRIAVANTWVNRCLYDATLPQAERLTWANTIQVHYPNLKTVGPTAFNPWRFGPLPSGLIGGMKLVFTRTVCAEQEQSEETPQPPHTNKPAAKLVAPGIKLPVQAPDVAAPKYDSKTGKVHAGVMATHAKFVAIAKEGKAKLVFFGDSITAGWAENGKEVWTKAFGSYQPANFGIGGDRTQHVLWRIQNGELDGIRPKAVIVLIGTNNSRTDPAEGIAKGITKIVETIREKQPQAKILLLAIFPRGSRPDGQRDELNAKLKQVNALIAKLDDGQRVFFLDIGEKLTPGDGPIDKEVIPDFVHLSPKGYQIWADAITPKLAQLME